MRVAITSAILLLSGCSALIFQTLWLRLSGLAFGNSVWSAALILSSFMAGLGLGSALAAGGRLNHIRPIRLYAVLEVVIALSGCALVFGLPRLGGALRPVFQLLWNHQALLNALRFALSFLVLLVPTTAMGLTLPVILSDPSLPKERFGNALGLFYGANTLGALGGALLGEGILVRALGLVGTGVAAGALNFVAAGGVLCLTINSSHDVARDAPLASEPEHTRYSPGIWKLLAVSFGGGGILLALEVIWFRFLRLYVASSATAFAVMLAVVLGGIGIGSLVAGAVDRWSSRSKSWPSYLLFAGALTTLLSYVCFPLPPLRSGDEAYFFESWREVARLSFPLMFPGALISGMLFPAVVTRVQRAVSDRMSSTGLAIFCNTAGATAGPLLAGFVLLPKFGFQTALIVCAIAYATLALVVADNTARSFLRPINLLLLTAFAASILLFPYHRDAAHFANARRAYETAGMQLVKKVEGTSDTYQLLRRDLLGEAYYYRLLTDAFTMSATNPRSQRYMRLFAHLPRVLRPGAKDALLVCFGLGQTADALTLNAGLERIDMVDISKEVFDLADAYSTPEKPSPLRDPRVHAIVQDGRFFLQGTPRRYDIITGEPPPPKVAGAVNLYTAEFFALMKSRLNEDGVATFWLPIYQLKVSETKAILRAFHAAFPNASVWASSDEEWIMTGINGAGRTLTDADVKAPWSDPATRDDLRRIGVEVPEQIGALFLMDSDEIERITAEVAPVSDNFPKRLSDMPGDLHETHRFALEYFDADQATRRFRSSNLMQRIWPAAMAKGVAPALVIRDMRFESELRGSNALAELDAYLKQSRLRTPVLEVMHSDEFRISIAEDVARKSADIPPEARPDLIAAALASRDIPRAIALLELPPIQGAREPNSIFLLTYLYCVNGEVAQAEQLARATSATVERDWFVGWLWGKLQAEYGFRPPT